MTDNPTGARPTTTPVLSPAMTGMPDVPRDGGIEWGYARVSTRDQDPAPQIAALHAAGVDDEHLVVEHVSGAKADRPGLATLLDQLQPADRLTVWRLDRLGRNLAHLVTITNDLARRGIAVRSLTENIDTASAAGRLVIHVFAALSEFERDLTRERTAAALAIARERGKPLGRRTSITRDQAGLIRRLDLEGLSHAQIARSTGTSRAGVGRLLRDEIPSLSRSTDRTHPQN